MKFFLSLIAALLIQSCAQMKASYISSYCNYEGAYSLGANAAKSSKEMETGGLASECPEASKAEALKGYREGYRDERSSRPMEININTGATPQQQCIENFGEKVCGFNCVESFGKVKCARKPHHTCIAEYGQIKCGENCRAEYGKIKCDKE